MEKEYIVGEPQRYEIGNRVFIVEPQYRKDGESMYDILFKLMMADTRYLSISARRARKQ